MKKKIVKISMILMLVLSCFITTEIKVKAADGTMQISDESAPVGETVNVTITVNADGAELGDCEATLSYDSEMLEFVEGTYAEETDDGIWIAQYGTGTETEFTFELQFTVLEEGSSTITLEYSKAYLYSDESLYLQATGGTISSEEVSVVSGDPIDIDGTTYYFYEEFSDALLLDGFSRSTMEYNGASHNVIVQDLTGRTAAYFVTAEDSDPILGMYDDATASFVSSKLINVSNDYFLILLKNGNGSGLSSNFAETTIEINGTVFPAWQNMEKSDYFLVYALSSEGFEGFYQYDSRENTYQRYVEVYSEGDSEQSAVGNGLLDKLKDTVNTHFIYIIAAVIILILVFIIVIIIMSSIIGKRNAEIDDLYDEIDEAEKNPKKINANKRGYDSDDEYDSDNEYDYDEDDEYDSDEEYDYDEDDEYDSDEEYDYDEDDEYDFDDDYDEDDEYDSDEEYDYDEDDEYKYENEYSVDFIDL